MDAKVLQVQEWLNQTYPNYFSIVSGSFPVDMDGITGNTTVKALVMALQIEVGATPVDGVMGSGTINKCPTIGAASNNRLLRIIQGGLFCKGYNAGIFDGIYGTSTGNAIISFKRDAGFTTTDGSISPMFTKALLNTDPFVMVAGSSSKIREVQQFLNSNYYNLFWQSLGLIPTWGKYERKTNKALIYAIQKEIGTTPDGAIGPNTFNLFPVVNKNSADSIRIKLIRCALICNGFETTINNSFDNALAKTVEDFQKFMLLNIDPIVTLGAVNRRTWGALLLSKGDTERSKNACDCSTKLSADVAKGLFDHGFRYVGRYLTKVTGGLDKNLTTDEVQNILKSGLSIFPIFQENNSSVANFTYEKGLSDAAKAVTAARSLKIPTRTVIYFAVDCDLTDEQISSNALPYFNAVNEYFALNNAPYLIGVYGSRNVCIRISQENYAKFSFVGDMSTGYSGNLGYKLPENWSFDQFYENSSYPVANTRIGLDYNIASGRDPGFTHVDLSVDYIPPYLPSGADMDGATAITTLIDYVNLLERAYWNFTKDRGYSNTERTYKCCLGVLDYIFQHKYSDIKWELTTPIQHDFLLWINQSAELDNLFYPYINYSEERVNDVVLETRPTLVSDNDYGLMEFAHLAIAIKCYLDSRFPSPWSTWAGDLATAINEAWVNSDQSTDLMANLAVAYARVGASEPKTTAPTDTRQFNYYDIIADIDGYKIAKLIQEEINAVNNGSSTDMYILSSVLRKYYGAERLYKNRFEYCLNEQGFSTAYVPNAIELSYHLVNYMIAPDQTILVTMFCNDAIQNNASVEAACLAYANFILYMYTHK